MLIGQYILFNTIMYIKSNIKNYLIKVNYSQLCLLNNNGEHVAFKYSK